MIIEKIGTYREVEPRPASRDLVDAAGNDSESACSSNDITVDSIAPVPPADSKITFTDAYSQGNNLDISWIAFTDTNALSYTLETVVSILNIRSLRPDLPSEFSDVFDQERYAKSQEYTKVTTSFGLIQSTIMTPVTILFILLGGFCCLLCRCLFSC